MLSEMINVQKEFLIIFSFFNCTVISAIFTIFSQKGKKNFSLLFRESSCLPDSLARFFQCDSNFTVYYIGMVGNSETLIYICFNNSCFSNAETSIFPYLKCK